jgi:hypothetical protein
MPALVGTLRFAHPTKSISANFAFSKIMGILVNFMQKKEASRMLRDFERIVIEQVSV